MRLPLRTANDNHPGLGIVFDGLPEIFIQTYSADMLDYADRLGRSLADPAVDTTQVISLWSPPDATILSSSFQGEARLRCDVAVNRASKDVTFFVRPASEEDREKIIRHCEALPWISAAYRMKNQERQRLSRRHVRAVFERVPEYFIQRYDYELREWGRNLGKIGLEKTIVLREGTLSDLSPDPLQGAELIGVKLKAKVERNGEELGLVVSPATERDERLIRRHCEKMTRHAIHPTARLVEPPRPGLPFMPTIAGAKRPEDPDQ